MKIRKITENLSNNNISEEDFKEAYDRLIDVYQKIHLHVFKLGRKLTPDQIEMLEDFSFKTIIDRSEKNKD